jgi:hypothetical protein
MHSRKCPNRYDLSLAVSPFVLGYWIALLSSRSVATGQPTVASIRRELRNVVVMKIID